MGHDVLDMRGRAVLGDADDDDEQQQPGNLMRLEALLHGPALLV